MNNRDVKSLLLNWIWETETILCRPLPDSFCLQYQYMRRHWRLLNLKNPATFNEKIQWMKLHYRPELLRTIVDKYLVRNYVRERVGEKILVELVGVYESLDEIQWKNLPDRFVLKLTHGSGWNILCKEKSTLDMQRIYHRLRKWLGTDFYKYQREWAYKGLHPRIICERFLSDSKGEPPPDYKFFCFGGEPRVVQVDLDRTTNHTRNLYDLNWNRLPFSLKYPNCDTKEADFPKNFKEMVLICRELSRGLPFARVDLYTLDNAIYFGEITIYPGGGLEIFHPLKYNKILGDYLHFPDEGEQFNC